MRTYTREQLIDAWAEYNRQVIEFPEKFQPEGVRDASKESATIAVDFMLSLIPAPTKVGPKPTGKDD